MIRGGHQLLAPALLRSQVLSLLYQAAPRPDDRHLADAAKDLITVAPIEARY